MNDPVNHSEGNDHYDELTDYIYITDKETITINKGISYCNQKSSLFLMTS